MKTGYYLVLEPDCSMHWELIEHENCLDRLYEIIGCDCVESVHTVEPDLLMIIDESGRIKNPPQSHNRAASNFYLGWLRMRCAPWDIVGTVVFAQLVPVGNCYGEMTWGPVDDDGLIEFVADMIGCELPPRPDREV